MNKADKKPKQWGWLVLLASTSTLLCCTLPILLVSLGMGAAVASIATNIPVLITLSMHKKWVFAGSGLMLILGFGALYLKNRECPANSEFSALCNTAHTWNIRLFWGAVIIWCIGAFFAFAAHYVLL